ncbi:MAG: helix-hairpin-helix domain-containing protein, partial [Bacteroidota bacterium]
FWSSDGGLQDSLLSRADSLLEKLTGEEGEPPPEEVLDNLEWIREHPYDLNEVTEAELEALPGITAEMAAAVVRSRDNKGGFRSLNELLKLGEELFRRLRPYVRLLPGGGGAPRPGPPFLRLRIRGERAWSRPEDPTSRAFSGSLWKTYGRLSLQPIPNLEAGVLFEKDAGEPVGYAFRSGYLALKDIGPVRSIVLGDFVVEAGQGIVLWRESGPGRGTDPVAFTKRSALGPQPYRYSGEVAFFRGIAFTLGCGLAEGSLRGSLFYSRRSLPGRVDLVGEFSGYHTTGLFRTETEQARLGALEETVLGARLTYDHPAGTSFGVSCYRSGFSRPFARSLLKSFSGSGAFVAGLDGRLAAGPAVFFGEVAISRPRGEAILAGAILSLSKGSSLGIAVRHYSPSFVDLHSNAFGETGSTRNEQGGYLGWSLKLNSWFSLSGSFDSFMTLWRSSRYPLPRRGYGALIRAEVRLTRRSSLVIRWRCRQTDQKETAFDPFGREVLKLAERVQQNLRISLSRELGTVARFRTRVELIDVRWRRVLRQERGILLYQDIRWKLREWMEVSCRLLFHETDSYDSRLYAFERDLVGVLGLPPLYGRGVCWYVFLRFSPSDGVTLAAKYSAARREPIRSAGEHEEPTRQRFSLQFDIRF